MLITDPLFYLAAIPAVYLLGISKGGFAGAIGGLGVPLMALAISPVRAAAILLPLMCCMDLVGFRLYYGKWDIANLRIMLPGALAGIVIGALTFGMFSEARIRILIGAIAVIFTIHSWLGAAARQAPAGRSLFKGTLWSGVSGFTSFVAHAGGPPVMVYMLPQRLAKAQYVATVSLFFMVVNAIKLVPYAWLGQFTLPNLLTSLVLLPLVPLGVRSGMWLQEHINTTWFYRISQAALLLSGVQLIYQGLAPHR
ncbi:sulfite exporter TauE/SafE family protein [Oxalobacteraceae bacterium]|nr:sulfite exporter TauE/SafE family protein [Oxalobacteraceae bacterium]